MYKKQTKTSQSSMFFTLEDQLNPKHPLFILAHKIRCEDLEDKFKSLYCQDNGCPCNPSDLVHFRNWIGEEGIELILKESIAVNEEYREDDNKPAFIDSTVQEKI